MTEPHDASVMYFHAWWNRVPATELGKDFIIMPAVQGKGRYSGALILGLLPIQFIIHGGAKAK